MPEHYRWRMRAPHTVPTMTVYEMSADAAREREQKVRGGASVVPFGFSRALGPVEPSCRKPLLWEGED